GDGGGGDEEEKAGGGWREVEVEEEGEECQEDRLDDQHQQQVAGELADVNRRLVAGRQDEPLPAVVLALGDERATQAQEPAQDEAEPQEARERPGEAFAVGA